MNEMTFGVWLSEWYSVYKKPRLKPRSQFPIEIAIRLHIPEKLKQTPLSALKVFELDKAIAMLPPSRTQKVLYDTIVSALFKAYKLELIQKDISKLLEPVRYTMKVGNALSDTELNNFLISIHGHKLEMLFRFYLLTGCRRHEALTLKWSDIDFSKNTLIIRGTKTINSFRLIPITSELLALLQELRQTSDTLFNFNDDYVTKTFKKFCPTHKLHDLRHTFATICAENNVHPSATQRMLGHSKIDTTMRIYTHVASAFISKEADKIDFSFLNR